MKISRSNGNITRSKHVVNKSASSVNAHLCEDESENLRGTPRTKEEVVLRICGVLRVVDHVVDR